MVLVVEVCAWPPPHKPIDILASSLGLLSRSSHYCITVWDASLAEASMRPHAGTEAAWCRCHYHCYQYCDGGDPIRESRVIKRASLSVGPIYAKLQTRASPTGGWDVDLELV